MSVTPSRFRQVLPARKLVGVPISVTDEQAMAFTVGGQTSCAVVRRAGIHKGDEVLVTAGTSNTSLFLLQAAVAAGAEVTAPPPLDPRLGSSSNSGAAQVFMVDSAGPGFNEHPGIKERVRPSGGFRAVLNPLLQIVRSPA